MHHSPESTRLYLAHCIVLLCGTLIGLAVAYGILSLPLSFGGDIRQAKTLGIVSVTILQDYSKTKDTFQYAVLATVPVTVALGCWLFWARHGQRQWLHQLFSQEPPPFRKLSNLHLCLIMLAVLLISFNVNHFYRPNSGWELFGEEGLTLAWAQSLLHGGVLSKEFSGGYAPLLLYPLALFMKIFGSSFLSQRIYAYLLNLIAYLLIVVLLQRTIRNRYWCIAAIGIYIAVFSPFAYFAPNSSYLRVLLGVIPLLMISNTVVTNCRPYLFLTGAIVGTSILLSQEVGICSLLACMLTFMLRDIPARAWQQFMRSTLWITLGICAAIVPTLLYFFGKGALGTFLYDLSYYPKLYAAGYSALPFPDFRQFLSDPFNRETFFHFWVIFVYITTALAIGPEILSGIRSPRVLITFSLLVFGMLLFRSALCRSDLYHVHFSSPPAFILAFILIDTATMRLRTLPTIVPAILQISLIAGTLLYLVATCPAISQLSVPTLRYFGLTATGKFSVVEQGILLRDIPRTGIFLEGGTALYLQNIKQFLQKNAPREDAVYFFPNDPALYFIFDLTNPTRYAYAYQAITTSQRLEIVKDLADKQVPYIVYNAASWRIDNINEQVQVPELTRFIKNNYEPVEQLGEITILKKIQAFQSVKGRSSP